VYISGLFFVKNDFKESFFDYALVLQILASMSKLYYVSV